MVTEAKNRGLDKNPDFMKQVREKEDAYLANKYQYEKTKDLKDPTTDVNMADFFAKRNNDWWMTETVKIDQVWCPDLKTANEVKAKLEKGEDVNQVRAQYGIEKDTKPTVDAPGMEGRFFTTLWNAEPNQIVGPIKGLYKEGLKWRVVKILSKSAGDEKREYNSSKNEFLKMRIREEQREAAIEKVREEVLAKYPHKIYTKRLKNFDPMSTD
jgi:hypothetical protein